MTSAASRDSATPQSVISRALQHALQLSDGLLEWLPIGVCVCDAEGYLVQYNNRAAEIWGQSPVIANREHRFTGAFKAYRPNGEPLRLDETPMAELLETGRPIRNRELVIERPDGSRLTILANLDPLRDEAGRLVGGVNCFQDITARKAAERRLQQREQWYRDLLEALPVAPLHDRRRRPHHLLQRGRRRALRQAAFPRRRCLVDWQQALLARREAHRAGGMSHGTRPQD